MKLPLCPLLLEPRLLPKPWGGRRLQAWGKSLPHEASVGESWELYDDEAGSSMVAAGPAQGRTLAEMERLWGGGPFGVTGKVAPGGFPLLVKLMDATENLSVQVHPDDSLARELHGPLARGKGEAWVVLEAKPDQVLYNGFKSGTTWLDVERALGVGRVMDLLNIVRVKVGDVLDVPAGRPHALGGGCLVAEVQQNSDHTYRLWDWGRLERGKARTLHLQEAQRALRFDALGCGNGLIRPQPFREDWGLREALLSRVHFNLERWSLKPGAGPSGAGPLWVLLAVSGSVRLRWRGLGASGASLTLTAGLSVLVPAGLPVELCAGPTGAVLLGAGLGSGQQD